MSKTHNLEHDLRKLAETIEECAIGSWYNMDRGCGCPMTQLIIQKELATEEEIEDTYNRAEEVWFLEPRLANYYPDDGKMIRMFPNRFDKVFDEVTFGRYLDTGYTTYSDDSKSIKEAILAAIQEVKNARIA